MPQDEQKQLARKRRERKLRAWMIALSWSTPVLAFGGFFTLWHQMSGAVGATSTATSPSAVRSLQNVQNNPILMQAGSRGSNVSMLQEDLAQLGYFHHVVTEYYGDVTAAAVAAFQTAHQLTPTGQVDSQTLAAIQQALKKEQMNGLSQSDSPVTTANSAPSNANTNANTSNQGSVAVSPPAAQPVITSSAS